MYTLLVADDEKIEREGIKFLLNQLNIEIEVIEAINGKQAYEILCRQDIDVLLTDIKMPFLNGIELIEKIRNQKIKTEIVIFSGYSEFEYAQKALKMGVVNYVLKPVDPVEFQKTMHQIFDKFKRQSIQRTEEKISTDFMREHLLLDYLTGKRRSALKTTPKEMFLEDFLSQWGRMILIECDTNLFENAIEIVEKDLKKELQLEFYYLNLNPRQSLLLFPKKLECDYKVLSTHIHEFLEQCYKVSSYIALSRPIEETEKLPELFGELEELMENKFYQTQTYLFESDLWDEKFQQSEFEVKLVQLISNDIKLKDMFNLRKHYKMLCEYYSGSKGYSQLYVKFIFSNIIKEIALTIHTVKSQKFDKDIEMLYKSEKIEEVINLTNKSIERLEGSLRTKNKNVRSEVEDVKVYIYENYREDLSVELLAEKVYLAPGYLSYIFKKETGENLSKFIKGYRMEKAKYLLKNTYMKINQICSEVGFSNVSYFCQSFREYFGVSPERYRKSGENEKEAL